MTIFNLPDLGEGLLDAKIHEWHVKVGDEVKADQPLVAVETAKAIVEVPSPQTGKIAKLYGQAGDLIQTHAPLVEFAEGADQGSVVGKLEQSAIPVKEDTMIIGSPQKNALTIKTIPAVRAFAKEHGIALENVKPTGPDGQITLDDVKKLMPSDNSLQGARYFMAKAMSQSHQEVVPVTLIDDADITKLSDDADITVHLIKAIIAAIKSEPILNSWFHSKTMTLEQQAQINLGLAIDHQEGLFVPVIKNIIDQSADELRSAINKFKNQVKNREVALTDMQGATITLTNFGMFAGRYATPIIMPPMVAIIGCGKIREIAAVYEHQLTVRKIAPLSLTFDHRAIKGSEASRFLGAMISALENVQ